MTKNKLASKLPIQSMIASVISSSMDKMASDESTKRKVQNLIAPQEEVDEDKTKTASAASGGAQYIEKLASAVQFISENLGSLDFAPQGVLQKRASEESTGVGAGRGPGSLEVTPSETSGTQNYNLGHARNIDASKSQAGTSLAGSHEGDGKTQLENTMHHAPGGGNIAPTAKYPPKGPLVATPTKTATVQDIYRAAVKTASPLRQAVLQKLAGEDVAKANIEAARDANPLAGMGQLSTTTADQSSPHQAGDHGGGYGNEARRLIASNQAAIDATKGDAKGPVKQQLHEVLEEPALSSSTDPVLEENLRNTGKAGVKIAAVRAALTKVAQQGCTCKTIDGECANCKMQKVAGAMKSNKGSTKVASMGMGGQGSMGMGGGSSMTPMADAGAGADGCTCGGTGECRVCKLKAALAAAMAQQGQAPQGGMPTASPVEKDSTGAGLSGGTY